MATAAAGLACLPMAASAAPAAALAPITDPVRIVVIGDSLAEGVWGSLYRRFYQTRMVRVSNATKPSTGFNRTPYEDTLRDVLAKRPIDVLVMMTGANDAQDAWGLDGGPKATFGTSKWEDLYRRRIRRFVDVTRERNVPLLWAGLPIMRSPAFEARIAQVRAAQRDVCQEYQVPFFDLLQVLSGDDGGYTNARRDENGHLRQLRSDDGVHCTEYGSDVIADIVLAYQLDTRPDWMTEDIQQIFQAAVR